MESNVGNCFYNLIDIVKVNRKFLTSIKSMICGELIYYNGQSIGIFKKSTNKKITLTRIDSLLSLNCGSTSQKDLYSNSTLKSYINSLGRKYSILTFQDVRYDSELFEFFNELGYNLVFIPIMVHQGGYSGLMICSLSEIDEVSIYFNRKTVSRHIKDELLMSYYLDLGVSTLGLNVINFYGSPFSSNRKRRFCVSELIQSLDNTKKTIIVGDFNSYGPLINTIPLFYHPLWREIRFSPSVISMILFGKNISNIYENKKIANLMHVNGFEVKYTHGYTFFTKVPILNINVPWTLDMGFGNILFESKLLNSFDLDDHKAVSFKFTLFN